MSSEPRPRLLVVEDNQDTQMLLRHLLRHDYEALILSGIDETLEEVDHQEFDLFLIDINLGEQRTGVDLLEALRKNDRSASTPALALTAYALPGDAQRFIDAGFDGYVSKPFTRDLLFSSIRDALSQATGTSD